MRVQSNPGNTGAPMPQNCFKLDTLLELPQTTDRTVHHDSQQLPET